MAVISVWLRARWPLGSIFTPVVCMYLAAKRDEPCQPPLGCWYPINPGLTCGVLSSRTRKLEKCPIQQRSIEEGAISGDELVEHWELVNAFTRPLCCCFSAMVRNYLEKLILSDPNPLRWTVESRRKNTRQKMLFFFQTPGMIYHLQKVCLNIWKHKTTRTKKTKKTFKPLQRKMHVYILIMQQISLCVGKP